MKTITKLWIGIVILIIFSPLGLLLPEYFKAGDAWGEWGADTLKELTGYVPKGLEKLSSLWNAPFPDYVLRAWEQKGMGYLSAGYIISAVIGITVIVSITIIIGKLLIKKGA